MVYMHGFRLLHSCIYELFCDTLTVNSTNGVKKYGVSIRVYIYPTILAQIICWREKKTTLWVNSSKCGLKIDQSISPVRTSTEWLERSFISDMGKPWMRKQSWISIELRKCTHSFLSRRRKRGAKLVRKEVLLNTVFILYLFENVCVFISSVSPHGVYVSFVCFAQIENFHAKKCYGLFFGFYRKKKKQISSFNNNQQRFKQWNNFRLCVFVSFICVMCAFRTVCIRILYWFFRSTILRWKTVRFLWT